MGGSVRIASTPLDRHHLVLIAFGASCGAWSGWWFAESWLATGVGAFLGAGGGAMASFVVGGRRPWGDAVPRAALGSHGAERGVIRVGAVVRLRSGGPAKTVVSSGELDATCRWFHGQDDRQEIFPIAALECEAE